MAKNIGNIRTAVLFVVALVSVVLFFAFCVESSSAAELDGKVLYTKNCQMCHLADGQGNIKLAAGMKINPALLNLVDEETSKKTDANLTKTVQDGNGKMKGFKDKLSKEEIEAIVKYVRSLKKVN